MAAGATYEPIATTTLSSAQSSIVFSSIPATYTDIRLILVGSVSASASGRIQVNGDTGANYSRTTIYGDGTSAASSRSSSFTSIGVTTTSISTTLPAMITADFMSYAGSTNKTILITESNDQNGSGTTNRSVGMWSSTSAITSVTFSINTGTLNIGTTATLYGIKAA